MTFASTDNSQITVQEEAESFVIRYRWFRPTLINIIFIPIALIGLTCLFFLLERGIFSDGFLSIIWLLSVYSYLATLINSTWISIDDETLSVRHTPLPWEFGTRLQRKQILSVDSQRKRKVIPDHEGGESIVITFEVIATLDQGEVALLNKIRDSAITTKIAQLANQRLKLLSDS